MSPNDSSAALTPIGPFQAEALPDPDPPVFTFQSSIAYYSNSIIYAGSDGKIYAYDVDTKSSTLVSDTSSLGNAFAAVTAFMVSSDDYLYFTDNGVTSNINRLKLTDSWPVSSVPFNTGIASSIFAFAENPWTNTIWFCSGDFFVSTDNFYLYEVDAAFTKATLRSSFVKPNAQPNGSGNGPIIFNDPDTVLYGEATFSGPGYFHLVNSVTGDLVQANYLTFAGGLGDVTHGYNNRIYVTTGGGKSIFQLRGSADPLLVGTTDDEARGITYGDAGFYISEMVPFSGGADDGKISFSSFALIKDTRLINILPLLLLNN
jgi:hypothetical protein